MTANPEIYRKEVAQSYFDQGVTIVDRAGRSAARARRALRDGDTRPLAARGRYSAIIDTSAIEVCAGYG
ncbi:hypothetical protein L0Z21_11780 [Burkholderia multivorans]|uniref:hypothetical protein n=1 Tax=Burkholderia multivorans TaxID=87883 RepID=UPI0020197294|nr:hypothetical protein [Burkholderia multivorans]MCO1442508.1 hypothetical protein [Burkholderia multivorans]UQO27643.1 hypothetical protein L0Z21_11780 [Burkholderia multivorans]UQO40971.1 hypothetical protein L0Z43_12280 [Burkholderia multivorans]